MTQTDQPVLAIVGATGAVGQECLAILDQRRFPLNRLRLLASPRSAGKTIHFRGEPITIEALSKDSFSGVNVAIFSAGGSVSREFAPIATAAGTTVIDNSSAYRMDPDVPLVVPEINGAALDELMASDSPPKLIANPNCSTIIALMAVTPLHRAPGSGGIKRMVVSTYQAASGGGAAMMQELKQQAHDFVAERPLTMNLLGRPYLFNLFSHNSTVGPNGYNEEEMKLVRETHKIWGDDQPRITATCVRVPVLRAHCEAINLTFRGSLSEEAARAALASAAGVSIVDDREGNRFPEPLTATGQDDVLVGRIRADLSQPEGKGLELFIAGDQLRKGAALNAIQIAERLFAHTDRHVAAAR